VANLRAVRRPSPILWLLFGLKGRISRHVYWLTYLIIIAVQSAVLSQIVGEEEASLHPLAASVGPIVLAVTLFVTLAVSVKRLHDVGYGGFLAVALFIPFVNIGFTIWLGILPGTPDPNQYGDAPDIAPA